MRTYVFVLVVLVVLVAAAACGPTINVTPINPSPRPLVARDPASVEIYTTKLPDREYVEVAVISASKGQADQHIDALRERAASYGCDALVFTVMPTQGDATTTGVGAADAAAGNTTVVRSSSATCVVWSDAAAGPPGG